MACRQDWAVDERELVVSRWMQAVLWIVFGCIVGFQLTRSYWQQSRELMAVQNWAYASLFDEVAFTESKEFPKEPMEMSGGAICVRGLRDGEMARVKMIDYRTGRVDATFFVRGSGQEKKCFSMGYGEFKMASDRGWMWFGDERGFGWGGRWGAVDGPMVIDGPGVVHVLDM